ncbi:MAG TPA: CzcE family metal-binding protein [Herbaspirillum sp.]|nr:CzcE family metal-binding protein [Herbaspirillum sp.]
MLKIKRITTLLAFAAVSSVMLASSAQAAGPTGAAADYGTGVAAGTNARQITISPQTKSVNVTNGETVKFDVNGKTFAWNVNTFSNDTEFDLAKIAPAGTQVNDVRVYVAANPLYRN